MTKVKEYAKIPDLIHRALTYGIKLDHLSRQEQKDYLLDLSDFINKAGAFVSDYRDDNIIIESKYMDPILAVKIRNNTLEFLPMGEASFFDSFMTVLSFISYKKEEKEILKEFKIFVDELDKEKIEKEETEEVDTPPTEDTEDDFDWI
tara:strand:+ start:4398 stop:4841 length:444 start_codon:yes stop_codon:yes gene_type:complete